MADYDSKNNIFGQKKIVAIKKRKFDVISY